MMMASLGRSCTSYCYSVVIFSCIMYTNASLHYLFDDRRNNVHVERPYCMLDNLVRYGTEYDLLLDAESNSRWMNICAEIATSFVWRVRNEDGSRVIQRHQCWVNAYNRLVQPETSCRGAILYYIAVTQMLLDAVSPIDILRALAAYRDVQQHDTQYRCRSVDLQMTKGESIPIYRNGGANDAPSYTSRAEITGQVLCDDDRERALSFISLDSNFEFHISGTYRKVYTIRNVFRVLGAIHLMINMLLGDDSGQFDERRKFFENHNREFFEDILFPVISVISDYYQYFTPSETYRCDIDYVVRAIIDILKAANAVLVFPDFETACEILSDVNHKMSRDQMGRLRYSLGLVKRERNDREIPMFAYGNGNKVREMLKDELRSNSIVSISAPTGALCVYYAMLILGSGKSVGIPMLLFELSKDALGNSPIAKPTILVVQPYRLAAESLVNFIQANLDFLVSPSDPYKPYTPTADEIAYKTEREMLIAYKTGSEMLIDDEVLTVGTLISTCVQRCKLIYATPAWTRQALETNGIEFLSKVQFIVLDEIHERTADMDMIGMTLCV